MKSIKFSFKSEAGWMLALYLLLPLLTLLLVYLIAWLVR